MQVGRKVVRNRKRRRAGVEQDHLPVAQQAGGRTRDRGLRRRCLLAPHGVGPRPDRGRQRTAVHPPHAPGLGELLEVTTDGVERDVERCAELRDDDLAVPVELVENRLAPLFGQHHAYLSTNTQITAESGLAEARHLAYTAPDNVRSRAVVIRLHLRRDPTRDRSPPDGPRIWHGLTWFATSPASTRPLADRDRVRSSG